MNTVLFRKKISNFPHVTISDLKEEQGLIFGLVSNFLKDSQYECRIVKKDFVLIIEKGSASVLSYGNLSKRLNLNPLIQNNIFSVLNFALFSETVFELLERHEIIFPIIPDKKKGFTTVPSVKFETETKKWEWLANSCEDKIRGKYYVAYLQQDTE